MLNDLNCVAELLAGLCGKLKNTITVDKLLLTLLLVFSLCPDSYRGVRAQVPYLHLSPFVTTSFTVATTEVEFSYGRPSMRGRKIFGGLEPWDVVWRSGANRNPRLVMSKDFYLGDTRVKAGSYTLFTKPNFEQWEVYLYDEINQFGVPETWDEAKVVATITVKPERLLYPRETLLYAFEELSNDYMTLVLEWETSRIVIPIGLTTSEDMEATIANTLAGPDAAAYSNAAIYYIRNGKDLEQALAWLDQAIAIDKTPSYWEHLFRAQALEKLGRKDEAIAAARKCLTLAEASGSEYGQAESKVILSRLE